MKKYRIKKITSKFGNIRYFAQVRNFFIWFNIAQDGEANWFYKGSDSTEADSSYRIERHKNLSNAVKKVELIYNIEKDEK